MGTKYYVDIEYRTVGDPSAGAGASAEKLKNNFKAAKAEADGLGAAFRDLGSSGIRTFTDGVERVGATVMTLGQVGAAAAIGGITYGVTKLNNELEGTTTSLAAVLNANGQSTGGINGALQEASKWVAQMKVDARDLPGEFQDLLGIVQTGAGSAFKIGLNPQQFEKLASSAMAAGKALAVPLDQAGRELAQLMEGRAGMHNVFGVRIGIDAHAAYKDIDGVSKKFNELTKDGRAKLLQEKIGAFAPAIAAFSTGYDAQFSTLVDNAKSVVQIGTKELFGRVVKDLTDVNRWFDSNRGEIEHWAKTIGHWLVDVHDRARAVAMEWGPILRDFGENAYKEFLNLWREAAPYVESIASHIKSFLGDKDAISDLKSLLKMYVAVKVGGAVASGGPFAGVLEAGLAAGGGGGGAAGGVMATGAGFGAAAASAAALAAAFAGVGLAVWQWGELQNDRARMASEEWGNFSDYARVLSEQSKSLTNEFGEIDLAGKAYQEELARITENSGEAAGALYSFAVALQNSEADLAKLHKDQQADIHNDVMDSLKSAGNEFAEAVLADEKRKKEEEKRKKDLAGRAHMTVNGNINFTISSNHAPDQIARDVERRLVDRRRFRTSSPHTRNFGVSGADGA